MNDPIKIQEKFNSLEDKFISIVKENFELMNHYDVNSLYPSRMSANKFPTDMICEFIGDITTNKETKQLYDNHVGVYKVQLQAPDIEHPLLPYRMDGTCVYGAGKWTGWFYSEELKNAQDFGYTFKILGGFVFESQLLFDKYIDDLYVIKKNSKKGSAMYLIGKLLMNSLFGRLGLDPFLATSKFITNDEYDIGVESKEIDPLNVLTKDFENHKLVITPNDSTEFSEWDGNVGLALAITANARIVMSTIKNNPNIKLYYTYTDSAFCEGELS